MKSLLSSCYIFRYEKEIGIVMILIWCNQMNFWDRNSCGNVHVRTLYIYQYSKYMFVYLMEFISNF